MPIINNNLAKWLSTFNPPELNPEIIQPIV